MQQISPLDQAVNRYVQARQDAENADAALDAAKEHLISELTRANVKSHAYEGFQTTLTKRGGYTFNEVGLRKALGARVYNKLTTAKLDNKKLEQAVESGTVDAMVVAQYATEKEGSTSIRMSEKKQ